MVHDFTQKQIQSDFGHQKDKNFTSYFNDRMEKQNKNKLITDQLHTMKSAQNTNTFVTPNS